MALQVKWRGFLRLIRNLFPVKSPPEVNGGQSRLPKLKKSVLLLSFNGQGYKGMQRNPNCPTIEGALFEALTKAGAIPPDVEPKKVNYQRCSRTDKGVSAARLAVSLKISINGHLPDQIRVFSMTRVTKSFHSRFYCNERAYEYVMPTYALLAANNSASTMLNYRIDDTTFEQVNRLLQYYVGKHNFHNFTSGRSYKEYGSRRHIMSFEACKKFVAKTGCKTCGDTKEMEFVVLRVRGSSFMLSQIRKMIGLIVAVVRGNTSEETILNAFNEDKVHVPRAPGLGLLLENVRFDGYNRRFAMDGSREPLEWSQHKEEIEQFKREHIYQTIIDTEVNEMSMMVWLCSALKLHALSQTLFEDSTDTNNGSLVCTDIKRAIL